MIAYSDYLNYYSENKQIIEVLSNNCPMLSDRIHDVIAVLDKIGLQSKKNTLPLDLEDIFNIGFSYLHEQIEVIKIYYNEYFKKDIFLFKQFETIIYYLLYIDDFAEALTEKECYSNKVKNNLESLTKELESILLERKKYSDVDLDRYNAIIESCVPHKVEVLTTDIIYSYILEDLQ